MSETISEVEVKDRWYTARKFQRAFPEDFPSLKALYKLAGNRAWNGMEEMGACVKTPGRPLLFNRANYDRWLKKYSS